MFKMSLTFEIYTKKDPFSRGSIPLYLVKVKEFSNGERRMVLCIQLKQMSQMFNLTLENIEYNNFVSNWKILPLAEIRSGGYMILQQIFFGLNFALLKTGKTPDSLTREELGDIVQTAMQKYTMYLGDPANGKPGLNQPLCW